ncbi:cadherin repeat domain-containing protein, partial [Porticoccaceae bacterium]|nr:cadherin repeat domain-containing protein [Porticoccaceae bacterium]
MPENTNTSEQLTELGQAERKLFIDPSDIQRIAGQDSQVYTLDVSEEQLANIVLYQQGDTLALEYEGEFVLAIEDFFNSDNNLALSLGGSLVFNSDSPVIDDGGVIWRREDEESSVLFWVGTGAGAAALGAAAGGGGGGGGGRSGPDLTPPEFSSSDSASPLPEQSGANIIVYQAQAMDLNPIVYSLAAGGDNDLFIIDSVTGEVTFTVDAEFDDQQNYVFTVIATDSAGNSSELEVTLPITEVTGPSPPEFVSDNTAIVDENSAVGTPIYTAEAEDPNGDAVTFSLAAGSSDAFEIDSVSGEVALIGAVDFEATTTLALNIVATDTGGLSSDLTVTITVNNVDEAPVFSSETSISVAENSTNGTAVYTAVAADPDTDDTISYSLTVGTPDIFAIDATSGVVTVVGPIDHEVTPTLSFTVVATGSGGLGQNQTVLVTVTDLDEAPLISSGGSASVAENAATDTVVYTAVAADPEGDAVVYSLGSGGDNALFTIDLSNGEVTLNSSADFESDASYSITVIATANGKTDTQVVAVAVTDVDEAPVIDSGSSATVVENSDVSAVIYTASAVDPEGNTVRYTLSGDDADKFNLDADSGELTLIAAADAETQASYNVTITASSTGSSGSALSSSQALSIAVTNVDEAPVISSGGSASVAENAATDTLVYTAVAVDPEEDAVVYSLGSGGDNALFIIDPSSGEVTLNSSADFESDASYSITVIATANGKTDSQVVVVAVTDVNEAPTGVALTSAVASLAEDADTTSRTKIADI